MVHCQRICWLMSLTYGTWLSAQTSSDKYPCASLYYCWQALDDEAGASLIITVWATACGSQPG